MHFGLLGYCYWTYFLWEGKMHTSCGGKINERKKGKRVRKRRKNEGRNK
jgi:hypothetical protein